MIHDCMWVREQGGRPKNSLFQSLSVDMTPLPAVLKLLQHMPSFLFSPPRSLVLLDLVACSKESSGQIRWNHTYLKTFACLPLNTLALTVFWLHYLVWPIALLDYSSPLNTARYAFTHSHRAFSTYTHTYFHTSAYLSSCRELVGVHDLNINLEIKLKSLQMASLRVHVLSYTVQRKHMRPLWYHTRSSVFRSLNVKMSVSPSPYIYICVCIYTYIYVCMYI